MKVERRLGLGTRVPPPKPAAEAQAVPRRFCCHRSLALGCLARAASVQMRQAEGQPPHLAPWRGGGACLTHGCCPAAKLCPWGCLFHRHSSPGGPVAALRTGLGLWAQEDLPRRAGAGCFLPAVQTLLIKQPARPHQGPCPSQTVGPSTQKAAGASARWGRQGGAGRGRAASDSTPVALPPGGAGLSHPVRHPGVLAAPAVPSPLLLVELVLPGRRVCQCAHLCPAPAWPKHMAQARWWFCAGRACPCFKRSQPLRSCVLSPQELPGSPTLGACVCWERRKFRQGPCTQLFIFPQD